MIKNETEFKAVIGDIESDNPGAKEGSNNIVTEEEDQRNIKPEYKHMRTDDEMSNSL